VPYPVEVEDEDYKMKKWDYWPGDDQSIAEEPGIYVVEEGRFYSVNEVDTELSKLNARIKELEEKRNGPCFSD
jgi:hypothetical protein